MTGAVASPHAGVQPIRRIEEDRPMSSSPTLDTTFASRKDEQLIVHEWRVEQLRRLGVPPAHAALFADRISWHAVADLVARGCPPTLALKIVH
jgi:hypothetical protein